MLFGLWVLMSAGAIAIAWTGVNVVDSEAVDPPPVVVSQQGETTEITVAVEEDSGTTEVNGRLDSADDDETAEGLDVTDTVLITELRGLRQFQEAIIEQAASNNADNDETDDASDDSSDADDSSDSDDADSDTEPESADEADNEDRPADPTPAVTPTPEPSVRPRPTPRPTVRATSTPVPTPTFAAFSVGGTRRPTATPTAVVNQSPQDDQDDFVVQPTATPEPTSTPVPPTPTPVPPTPTPTPPPPTPTATPIPTPTLTPTPTPVPPTPTPAPEVITAASVGGVAAFEVSSMSVAVLWASPNEDFSVFIDNDGDEAAVRFESVTHLSRIEVWWNGVPRYNLKETPLGAAG